MTVFLSYSRRDVELVNRLYADLVSQGLEVWMDRNAIEAGSLWRTSIVDGIETCRVFLLVVSAASQESANVAKEVALAESNRKRIVPVKIDNTPIHPDFSYSLAGIQFVDLYSKGYAASLAEILDAIRRFAAVPDADAPPAAGPQAAGLAAISGVMAESAALRSAVAIPSPRPASATRSSGIESADQESVTLISQESLSRMQQVVAEELGPIVKLIWSEQFAQSLLNQPEAIAAKLMSLGVPEATALRLRKRLQSFL